MDNLDRHDDFEKNPTTSVVKDVQDEQNNSHNYDSHHLSKFLTRMHMFISSILVEMALISVRNPKVIIVSTIILCLSFFSIGLSTNFNVETDVGMLCAPKDSQIRHHSNWLEKDSAYPRSQPEAVLVNIHAEGKNVLEKAQEGIMRVFTAIDTIRNITGYDDECKEATVFMKENHVLTTCYIKSSIKFWDYSIETFINDVTSDRDAIKVLSQTTFTNYCGTVCQNVNFPIQDPVDEDVLFGNAERDEDGLLIFAQMFSNFVFLPGEDENAEFIENILRELLQLRKKWEEEPDNMFRLEIQAGEKSFNDESKKAIVKELPLVALIFIVMSIFTCIIFYGQKGVYSQSILGVGAVCTILLSMMASYGLLFIIGVPFTVLTTIVSFIMFGIGLDDTFILWGSYQRTDQSKRTEERIRDTIEDVGISIFMTTTTSTVAFSLGTISSLPFLDWLCCYAALTIAIDFILQITFFVALIEIDERRVKDRRRDCLCCLSTSSSLSVVVDDNKSGSNKHDAVGNIFERFMSWYSHVLMKPLVKILVVIFFLGLFMGFGYSATKQKQKFDFSEVLPSSSYVQEFFVSFVEYSGSNGVAPYIIFRDVDQSNPEIQIQMEQYVNDLVAINAIDSPPSLFWLRDFNNFLGFEHYEGLYNASFTDQLDAFLSIPIFYQLYNHNIVRNENGNIVTSRTRVQMKNVNTRDTSSQIEALRDVMNVSESQAINKDSENYAFFTFDKAYFVWLVYIVIPGELLLSTILGVVTLAFISLIFIPNWITALIITSTLSTLYVELLGFLQVFGVTINPISSLALVASIGILLDFLLHILLRYYESKAFTRQEKVQEALRTVGTSVLISGISTFLGVIPLAFTSTKIFHTVFITFLGIVILGCVHGLVFLPVLLSLIGPKTELPGTKQDKD